MTTKGPSVTCADTLREIAGHLRHRADNPVPSALAPAYVEGFADGMRCAADVLVACADAPPEAYRKGSQRATDQVECAKCGSTGPDGWCEWCKAPVTKSSS